MGDLRHPVSSLQPRCRIPRSNSSDQFQPSHTPVRPLPGGSAACSCPASSPRGSRPHRGIGTPPRGRTSAGRCTRSPAWPMVSIIHCAPRRPKPVFFTIPLPFQCHSIRSTSARILLPGPRGRSFHGAGRSFHKGCPDFPWLRNSEFALRVWPCSPLPPPLFVFVPYMYRAESVHIQNMAHVVIIFCMNSWNAGRTDSRHSERAVECH